ncbi:MAG: flavodoxin-dependent (E)-4-hydroxy-3-methylbut-2-enyl-diphosphate synthase, partial [Bacteroidales bacterium]
NLVMSMKASNPRIMAEACRLLNARMIQEGVCFPQHLGVTEAGEGQEGRMRSSVGIGALLADGIGHTVRVSLTEAPEKEIQVAKLIVDNFKNKKTGITRLPIYTPAYDTFEGIDRNKLPELFNKTVVAADLRKIKNISDKTLTSLNFTFDKTTQTWQSGKRSPEILIVKPSSLPQTKIQAFILCENAESKQNNSNAVLIKTNNLKKHQKPAAIECLYDDIDEYELEDRLTRHHPIMVLNTNSDNPTGEVRSFINRLENHASNTPLLIKLNKKITNDLIIAAEYGALLVEDRIAGVVFEATEKQLKAYTESMFDLLQAAGLRRSKAEFISCPGCGRTLFDLEKTTSLIKAEFGHLEDIKIAVMGCIVNGPGEMLDADYGYIGAGNGKISLYKNQKAVITNIPEEQAVDALKKLLKKHNDWQEPNPPA